jgi:hypothetical protein
VNNIFNGGSAGENLYKETGWVIDLFMFWPMGSF